MTKVRCAYTSCKNNKPIKDGYLCKLKNIHLVSIWNSETDGTSDDRMQCENFVRRKDYAR